MRNRYIKTIVLVLVLLFSYELSSNPDYSYNLKHRMAVIKETLNRYNLSNKVSKEVVDMLWTKVAYIDTLIKEIEIIKDRYSVLDNIDLAILAVDNLLLTMDNLKTE